MCACANKGEKKHSALRVHTCGESCTGKGEMHGVSALEFLLCLAPGFPPLLA